MDLASADLDDEKDVVSDDASEGEDLGGEEVGSSESLPMSFRDGLSKDGEHLDEAAQPTVHALKHAPVAEK
ncbi:MAG: hypothetical protein R6V49_08465 [Bacteroidales bacterium]